MKEDLEEKFMLDLSGFKWVSLKIFNVSPFKMSNNHLLKVCSSKLKRRYCGIMGTLNGQLWKLRNDRNLRFEGKWSFILFYSIAKFSLFDPHQGPPFGPFVRPALSAEYSSWERPQMAQRRRKFKLRKKKQNKKLTGEKIVLKKIPPGANVWSFSKTSSAYILVLKSTKGSI